MSENKIKFPVKLASNNPQSFGIVDATEISGHRSVDTLSDLYAISDPMLSILKDGSDSIGQEWFVVSENCKYRLDNWGNRKSIAGWTKLPKQELINTKQSTSEKDQPGGYAGLDSNGKLPIEKTYGDTATVVEVETYELLPAPGLSGIIYYVSSTSAQYKWSGSAYIDITDGADNAKKNETSIFDCSNGTSTKYYSSLSNAINVVPPVYRTSNRIISYLSTESSPTSAVNYQYHGIDSTTWTDLTKWERIPNQADLTEIRSDLNSLGQETEINYILGGFVDTTSESLTDGAVGILAGIESVVTDATWKYAIVECEEGDIFTISGTSAGWARLWTWLDSKKRIINCSNHGLTVSNHVIIAPKNSKYLISNNFDLSNGKLIHGFSVSNTNYILKERDELLNSSDMNINFVIGGMDNGIPNTDPVAVHSAEFLKVNNQNVCIYSDSYGVVLQFFDENKQYISFVMNGQQGLRQFSLDSSVKYVKICLFHEASTPISGTNPEVNNSKVTINSFNVYFSGLEKESIENITYPVLTEAYKASSVHDGKVLFQRNGEGVIDQIQLIGAFDTTSSPKNEFWVNYHQTILQITVDGEVSVRGTIYDLCGLSSNIITREEYVNGIFENAIFQTPLFSKTGLYSGITFNFKIPYYKSIKIELLGTNGAMWGMVKSLTNVDFEIGGVKIPYGAKFHGITVSQSCVKGDLIVLMDTIKSGMLLGVNVAGTSNMFDWVEGCIRAFKYGLTTQDKCTMLSSGLEDYLGGAFGFNIGEKQFENWGCTLNKMILAENYRLCGYRNHLNDKVLFDGGGFKVAARWGDQNAANWDLSNTDSFAGQTGNPGVGNFYATAFYYDWE